MTGYASLNLLGCWIQEDSDLGSEWRWPGKRHRGANNAQLLDRQWIAETSVNKLDSIGLP
jgi:hypothetical protein